MTLQEAKALAIKKWELIIANEGNEPYRFPDPIEGFLYKCSYCELYFYKHNPSKIGDKYGHCFGCPLRLENSTWNDHPDILGIGCWADEHPFRKWHDYTELNFPLESKEKRTERIRLAKEVLRLITGD